MDSDYASFDCAKGPDSASWVVREYHFISEYKAGFEHGVSDAKGPGWYILEPDNGFGNHSDEFDKGYIAGFCSIAGPNFSSGDTAQAKWDCTRDTSGVSQK
jgi:hypothetical protein